MAGSVSQMMRARRLESASKPRLPALMKSDFAMRKLTVCGTKNGGCLEFCKLKSGARALHETGRGKGISIARNLLSPSLFVRLILSGRLIPAYEP